MDLKGPTSKGWEGRKDGKGKGGGGGDLQCIYKAGGKGRGGGKGREEFCAVVIFHWENPARS